MSSKNEFLDNAMKRMEDLIRKGNDLEGSVTRTERKVSDMSKLLTNVRHQIESNLESIIKTLGVSEKAVTDVVRAFVNLKVVPNELAAVTKYQDILIKGVKDYSAAINDGHEDAVKFFNANKKEYDEVRKKNDALIAGYEKRIAAGEKLNKTETKKLNLARKENQEMVPLLDSYRKERKEIDAVAKAKEQDVKASQKKAQATKESAEKGKKVTEKEIRLNKELSQSLKTVLADVKAIRTSLNADGGLQVKINNAGFTRVLDEMSNAIKRFHERAEGSTPRRKNFFDQMLGTREENKKSGDDIVKEAKGTISQIKNDFLNPLGSDLTAKISKAVSQGIKNGIREGIIGANEINPMYSAIGQLANDLGMSQAAKQRLFSNILGKKDVTAIEQTQIIENRKLKQHQYDTRNANNLELGKYKAEMAFEHNVNPDAVNERIQLKTEKERLGVKKMQLQIEKELQKEKRAAYNREINEREQLRIEQEKLRVYGEEGTLIHKLGTELVDLYAKRRQIKIQSEELNKLNFAEMSKNTERIKDTTRKWAIEMYKVQNKTAKVSSLIETMQTVYTRIASLTQTASAAISAASGLFSNMRSAATSFFRYFTNGFRRAFSYVRQLATSTFQAGIEQRKKIEQAQIGFAAFFGEENVPAVTSKVRAEAAKTPIVDAGSLANYVQQLAPVSKGNAGLAINASLGILKSLVYSGSDISEGEYVIKNIRDVIAKGKATAIDIRQFNRALPGLEQALRESGQDVFIDKEGKLNITSKNVGQVLDMFAKLNTDENSPLKNIEEKQLKTLSGLEQLFTEKKTTAMELILEKSGFFDLMYQVLGIANDDGKWSQISNLFANILKPIVTSLSKFLNDIDWREVEYKIKAFFSTIWEGVKIAKETIGGALGNAFGNNTEGIMQRLAGIIKQFIIGFGDGTKQVIDFVNDVTRKLSGGNIEKFVEMVGKFLVSPLGKLIQMMLGLAQNGIGALSRVFANISSAYKGLGDIWNWAVNQRSTAFGNRVVSNLKISDMTAAQFSQVLAGKPVTASGKDMNVATRNIRSLGDVTGQATSRMAWFKEKASALGMTISRFAIKLGSAVTAGGTVNMLLGSLSMFMRTIDEDNQLLQNMADAIDVVNGALTGGIVGGMLGGVAGGLAGAVIGATVALIKLRASAINAAERESKERIAEIEDEERKVLYNKIIDVMSKQGINTDTGTDEGWYASQKLIQYLNTQDPSAVNISGAVSAFTEALKWKNQQRELYDAANSDEFNNLSGGKVLDLNQKSDLRDNLDKIITWYRLNGDNYTYTSAESNIHDFMNANGFNEEHITEEQARMLIDKCTYLDGTMDDQTTELGKLIETVDEEKVATEAQIEALSKNTGMTVASIKAMIDLQREIRNWRPNNEEYEHASKGVEYKWSGNSPFAFFLRGFDLFARSLGSIDIAVKELHDRSYFDPTAAGRGDFAFFGEGDKEYNVFWYDIGDAIEQWLNDNGYSSMDEVPLDQYAAFYEMSQKLGKYEGTAPFMNDFADKLPWLWEYVKKVILTKYKQTGGMIEPVYRATGGLGVDTVPAMLQPGEFVMRRSSVNKAGLSTMLALNRGDMVAAARSLGSRFNQSWNNSRNWNSVVNNNQKTQSNLIKIFNRNTSARVSSYYSLANRIALS